MESVQLIDSEDDKFSIHLRAYINEKGDLVLEGQDLGSGVEEYWGDSDYEYWVVVNVKDKITTFFKLTQFAFRNIDKLIEWLDSIEINYRKLGKISDDPLITAEVDSEKIIFSVNQGGLGIKKVEPMLAVDLKDEDKLILYLLKHMFKSKFFENDAQFMGWLKKNGIDYMFDSYV